MSLAKTLDPLLEPILSAVRWAEQALGPSDDWVEDDRRILFETAQWLLGDYHTFIYEVNAHDYLTTVHATPDAVETALMPTYQRNLASARKYREHHDGGRQWAVGSFVLDPVDERWQHHVVIFPAPDGGTEVYTHTEVSVRSGWEHLSGPREHGTPGEVFDLLERAGFEYGERDMDTNQNHSN